MDVCDLDSNLGLELSDVFRGKSFARIELSAACPRRALSDGQKASKSRGLIVAFGRETRGESTCYIVSLSIDRDTSWTTRRPLH